MLLSLLFIQDFVNGRELYADNIFGEVFDVQGKVTILNKDGEKTVLTRDRHILYPVREGDRIKVEKTGKVVVMPYNDRHGYEILSNSEVRVANGKIVKIKGTVNIKEILHPPKYRGDNGREAGTGTLKGGFLTLRGAGPCVRAVSPVNTTVLELTPEFRWENNCGDKKVVIKISENNKEIFRLEHTGSHTMVPEGALKYGKEYIWEISTSESGEEVIGRFSIPEEEKVKSIKEQILSYKQLYSDLSHRLSYLFYLLDNNLSELARAEIEKLKAEFPENSYIEQLME